MTHFKQLIPGNPGTSFIVCLLYTLKAKYGIKILNEGQLAVFTKGILSSRKVFFSGALNVIATKFKRNVNVFTNNRVIFNLADDEINRKSVKLVFNKLKYFDLIRLLEQFKYLTLSVDFYYFYPYYHDYHFCCLSKNNNEYLVFEPKSGDIRKICKKEVEELANSMEKSLKDSILVFCC